MLDQRAAFGAPTSRVTREVVAAMDAVPRGRSRVPEAFNSRKQGASRRQEMIRRGAAIAKVSRLGQELRSFCFTALHLRQQREVEDRQRRLWVKSPSIFECGSCTLHVAKVQTRRAQVVQRHRFCVSRVDCDIQPNEAAQTGTQAKLSHETLKMNGGTLGIARRQQPPSPKEVAPVPALHSRWGQQRHRNQKNDGK